MKFKDFIVRLTQSVIADETIAVAGELTYKLMLSMFPLITFLLSLLGFLNIEMHLLEEIVAPYLPQDINHTLMTFIHGLSLERNTTLLSLSLVVTLVASSSGFRAMMRGISKSYGVQDSRPYLMRFVFSVALTLVFSATILVAVVAIIFRDTILGLLWYYALIDESVVGGTLTGLISYGAAFFMMLVAVTFIYKVSVQDRTLGSILPGSVLTVCLWLVSARIFNMYVMRFPVFSLQGGIASAFIMLLWLNVISVIMLLGAQLNAALESL